MRVYFSGIGGVGIGPLAEIAIDAGYDVLGSDREASPMTDQLVAKGVDVIFDQSGSSLKAAHQAKKIDWLVYTAALPSDHPELVTARELGIKTSKRDEFLARLINDKNLKLIAIAGTHGKTTTTGMFVWCLKQLGIPASYSVGSTLSFGPSGKLDPKSQFFVYECDEFDRNFLNFKPWLSLITSIEYDHPDTYPKEQDYLDAFRQFIQQSQDCVMYKQDAAKLGEITKQAGSLLRLDKLDESIANIRLAGLHSRQNAKLVLEGIASCGLDASAASKAIEHFPGTGRRFEKLAENLYSDYGHHPAEIKATLQMAKEIADSVVLVYQPHQNIRQHEVRGQYTDCMEMADKIYWLPTYLAREDESLEILTPKQLTQNLTNQASVEYCDLNDELWDKINQHRQKSQLVLCMGAGTIDGWLRQHKQFD